MSTNGDILKISVVMCTYNGARYIREQLETILKQSYPIHEIIVQDDESSDETFEIVQQMAEENPLIHAYRNESGVHGINGNFFSAMARATGDYIAISDQDDLWESDKLRLQAEAIGNKMLCTGFSVPFSDGGYPVSFDPRVPNTHLIRMTYICAVPGHSMLFKREMLDYIKGGEVLPLYYDWQLVNVASAAESIVFVEKTLVNFRRHADSATAAMPVGHQILSSGGWNYIKISLFYHHKLQALVRRRFSVVYPFLQKLPFETQSLKDALYMSQLQLQRGPVSFIKRVVFFMKHSHCLFHAEERRPLIRILRAMFFVFSCGFYYRGQLK